MVSQCSFIFFMFWLFFSEKNYKIYYFIFLCTLQKCYLYLKYVQPLPLYVSSTLSSSQTLYSLNTDSLFPFCTSVITSLLLSSSVNSPTIGTSCKWNHTIFVLLSLVYFTEQFYFDFVMCEVVEHLFIYLECLFFSSLCTCIYVLWSFLYHVFGPLRAHRNF